MPSCVPEWEGLCSDLKVEGLSPLGPQGWPPSSQQKRTLMDFVGALFVVYRGLSESRSADLRKTFTALLFSKESGPWARLPRKCFCNYKVLYAMPIVYLKTCSVQCTENSRMMQALNFSNRYKVDKYKEPLIRKQLCASCC